jgi:ethanolamine utilization protein EutQ (cupin superfamily)
MNDAARKPHVMLLREHDAPFEELAPGRQVTQVIDNAGITDLGGGFFHQTEEGAEYTGLIKGDEVLFVYEGELEVIGEDGSTAVAHAGEAVLVARGQTVTFRGQVGTRHFWIIHPAVY